MLFRAVYGPLAEVSAAGRLRRSGRPDGPPEVSGANPDAYAGIVSAKLDRCTSFSYSFARFGYGVRQSISGKRKSR